MSFLLGTLSLVFMGQLGIRYSRKQVDESGRCILLFWFGLTLLVIAFDRVLFQLKFIDVEQNRLFNSWGFFFIAIIIMFEIFIQKRKP